MGIRLLGQPLDMLVFRLSGYEMEFDIFFMRIFGRWEMETGMKIGLGRLVVFPLELLQARGLAGALSRMHGRRLTGAAGVASVYKCNLHRTIAPTGRALDVR